MVDWARLDAMTDEEIEAAARSDPDNPPLTDEQLAQMRLIVHRRRKKRAAAE
jgi:putative transcriptional regulator